MRLLITTDTVGGVWTFTQELVSGLLERGCSVALVSFGRSQSDEQRQWCAAVTSRWGDHFYYESSDVSLEWMQNNSRAYLDAAPLLMRLARSFDAEVLHSNQFCFGALPLPIPKIITAHSDVLSWADACRGGELEDSGWLSEYRALVQAGLDAADAVVAPTRWMADALARHFTLSAEARVIPNGRSVPAMNAGERKLQAVTVGRLWDEAKDVAMLQDVHSPMPLLVAGESELQLARSTSGAGDLRGGSGIEHAQVPKLRDAGHVPFALGALGESELFALFRQSAIYICTSRYEPFGLAPLEAALCGCAVLARDIPSLREVWQDGALYFSDAAGLSKLLRVVADDPELLAACQQRSHRRAQHFSADKMTDSYLQMYFTMAKHEAAAHVS